MKTGATGNDISLEESAVSAELSHRLPWQAGEHDLRWPARGVHRAKALQSECLSSVTEK